MAGRHSERRQSSLHLPPGPAALNRLYGSASRRIRAATSEPGLNEREPAISSEAAPGLQALVECFPDPLLRYDRRLQCFYANSAVETCLGRPRTAFIGRNSSALGLSRRLVTLWDDTIRLVFANGQPMTFQFAIGVAGTARTIEARMVAETERNGSASAVTAILRDITEQTHAHQALLRKAEELQRSHAELEEFAYLASHDLKAPLRTAHALSSWIEEEVAEHLSDTGRERMEMMRARLRRMDELINATLEYARAGARHGETTEFPLDLLVNESVELCEADGHRVTVVSEVPQLHADRGLLRTVLAHLIDNALTHHDRADGRVWVTCREHDRAYEFSVIDDGPGIPPEFHRRIFHMFQRGPDVRPGTGHGIGLAVAKKMVEAAGGTISVDSAPGWGSTFEFSWPRSA